MKLFFTLIAVGLSVLALTPASADVIFSNDFESETVGSTPDGFLHVGGAGSSTLVATGGSNQYLELKSRSDNGNYAFGNFDGSSITDPGFAAVTTFSFDATFADSSTTQIRLRARDTAFSGGATDVARFDLNLAAVTVGTSASYDYVINNSTSAAIAPKQGSMIAAGSWAFYQDGTVLNSGSNFTTADGLAVDKLTLWVRGDTATNAQGTVQIDNFTVNVNAVPEPGSCLVLLGMGIAAIGVRRKRS